MASTQKGGQWYFGMKAHIGVDSQNKLIHSVVVTSANVHDSQVLGVIKNQFEYRKVRYKRLTKNTQAVFTKCALANIVMAKRHLMAN